MPTIDYDELESAMHFVSAADIIDASARISRDTGKIYWVCDEVQDEEPLPADIDDDSRYVEVPDQRELDLGKRLVLKFTSEHLPDHFQEVDQIFRKRGAYTRFKDLLEQLGELERWYKYESAARYKALCDWAAFEGFEVSEVSSAKAT